MIKEAMPDYDPELCVLVGVRHKETKKEGLTFLYNEEEVDRRLEILDKAIDSEHREIYDELVEFHHNRRAEWKKVKNGLEIVLLSPRRG